MHEDYAPVGLYYRAANQCWPGICPHFYTYLLAPDLSGTIESYMGRRLALAGLAEQQAFAFGHKVGQFFRTMHAQPPPLAGFGYPIWNGAGLAAADHRSPAEIWPAEEARFREQFDRLGRAGLQFDRAGVRARLEQVLAERSPRVLQGEAVVLANRDISPENLLACRGRFSGLVDPVPLLHSGLRYAAFFVYCYRSYLPNLHDAPRYARHRFETHRPAKAALAEGYLEGYTRQEAAVRRKLHLEYFIWAVEAAYENLNRVTNELTEEIRLRAGDRRAIAARLQRCLGELETYHL